MLYSLPDDPTFGQIGDNLKRRADRRLTQNQAVSRIPK
jgi:hypothetical protein